MSKRQNQSEPKREQDRTYQWIGEGENRDGAIRYRSVRVGDDTFEVCDAAVINCYGNKEGVCRIEELFENVHTQEMEMRVCWYYQQADVIAQFGKKRASKLPTLKNGEVFLSNHKQLLSVECIDRKALVLDKRQQKSKPVLGDDTFLCQFLLNMKDCSLMPSSSSCLQEDVLVRSPRKRLRDESDSCTGNEFDSCNAVPCQPKSLKRKHLDRASEESNLQKTLLCQAIRSQSTAQSKYTLVHEAGGHFTTITQTMTPSPVKGSCKKRLPKAELKNGKPPQGLTRKRSLIERKVTEMTPEIDKLSHNKGSHCRARKSLRLTTAHVVDLVTDVSKDSSYSLSYGSMSDTEDESSQESLSTSSPLVSPKRKRRNILATPPHAGTAQKKPASATAVDKKKSVSVLKKRSQPMVGKGQNKELHSVQMRLHTSSVPRALPCREEEFESIRSYVETRLFSDLGGCMYISGVPGTGKTATVKGVAQHLQKAADQGEIPPFKFIELNGMQLTEPSQAFVTILKQLTGQKASASRAAVLLEQYFGNKKKKSRMPREKILLLADELDMLWTRNQSVLYRLFEWPTQPFNSLIVIAVANTMDLPERIMANRVASRLGPTRLTFHPYTFQQLQEIVLKRIGGIDVFAPDAIQLAARKVAAVSGDARRALDLCRRAVEFAQEQSSARTGKTRKSHKAHLVEMEHINQAVQEMCSSPMIMAVRRASRDEKMFLQAVMVEFQRTGLEETNMKEVYHQFSEICQLEGIPRPSFTAAYCICQRLWTVGVLLVEPTGDLHRRIRAYMNPDDILFALRQDY